MSAVDFLKSLADDPQRVERVKANPDAEMDAAGLSEEEKNAIKSGNPAEIRRVAGFDASAASDNDIVAVAVIVS